jgi:Spx/MgsR family transcriptional regulator
MTLRRFQTGVIDLTCATIGHRNDGWLPLPGGPVIEAYLYTSCTSCRKTEAHLHANGVDYERRDYFRDRFTRDELASILARAGLAPREILSRRSKVYQARATEIDNLDDDALLDLMIDEPTLLRRPLVIGRAGAVVGHNAEKLDELIRAASAP